MSTDKIDPRKNYAEVPPKGVKTELTEKEMSKVSGGGSLSMPYEEIKFEYTKQK